MVAKDECCAGLHLELPGFYGHFNIAHGWGRGQKLGKRGPSVVIINIKNWSNHGQISNHNTLGKDTGETRERGGGGFTDFCSWTCASRTSNFDFRYTFSCPKRLAQIRITCQCENPSGFVQIFQLNPSFWTKLPAWKTNQWAVISLCKYWYI